MTIHIGPALLRSIVESATASMPHECCGILLGRVADEHVVVECVRPADNVWPGDRRRRFEIDPHAVFEALRTARHGGPQVVGFYHSHPDGSFRPSRFDRELAWPEKAYLIVGIGKPDSPSSRQNVTGIRCWRRPVDSNEMVAERVN